LQIDGINRRDDLRVSLNRFELTPLPEVENKFAWDSFNVDVLYFDVPHEAMRQGENQLLIQRHRRYPNFVGHIEFQECELEVRYPNSISASMLT
jgi:hypothetical protein